MSKTKPVLRSLPDRQRKTRAGAPDALGSFPQVRPRRNRGDAWTRRLTAENHLTADDLILPIFVQGQSGTTDVPSLPGIARHGLDCLVDEVGAATDLGIPAIAVFPFMDDPPASSRRAYHGPSICRGCPRHTAGTAAPSRPEA